MMRVVNASAEILTPLNGPEVLKTLEACGRLSWKSEDKTTDESAPKFIQMLLKAGHESVIEHVNASVRFIVDRGCCYDDKTEVLTRSGWKSFSDVDYRDEMACLNDSNELEWHVPKKLHRYMYDGDMLAFETTSVDLLVTPNHNMWVLDYEKRHNSGNRTWKFLQADQLKNKRYVFNKTAMWYGEDHCAVIPSHHTKPQQFNEIEYDAEQTADLFELLGFWITDGCYEKGGTTPSIIITQVKLEGCRRIEYLCKKLSLRFSWHRDSIRIDNARLGAYVVSLFGNGPKTFTAFVPSVIKESSSWQIKRFLDGVVAGDGNVHKKNGHVVVYSSSYRFAGDLQELWLKVGLSANIRTIAPRDGGCISGVLVNRSSVGYVVSVHGELRSYPMLNRGCAKKFGENTPYSGWVYCAEVPYHRLYVRRNGKPVWCGNSHELVRHRLTSVTQESTRYVSYADDGKHGGLTFIQPIYWNDGSPEYCVWVEMMEHVESAYNGLINMGATPQEARAVLPNSVKTELIVTANLREWRHILKLRAAKPAHPQMREVCIPLLVEFRRQVPVVFDDIVV